MATATDRRTPFGNFDGLHRFGATGKFLTR
jgi:hypothetical protein